MDIGLLGELEVLDDEGHVVVGAGAKLRSLLTILALHAGRVVPAEHLIEALWSDNPPAEVRNGLQGLVSKLRRALGSADLIVMRVGGETTWPVPPLAADDAIGLFLTRARQAGVAIELADDDDGVIADICTQLDGLPLAIELAAARTRAFPIAQIAARLNDRFHLLTGGSRTALPRQQTLRAVVDWSYELLFEDEQRIFERLSVFPGGCDLDTAERVCSDDAFAADDVADHLHALVEQSLVVAVPVVGGLRFTKLQTLAQYGAERLAERGDALRIRDAMAAHYARLCSQSAAAFTGDLQRSWLTAMDRENDNLRAALDWAVANDDAETALMIAGGGAAWPHWLTGMVVEGRRWLADAFACRGPADERTRALALTGRGLLDFLAGEIEHCDDDLATALEIFGRHHDVESMAMAHSFYAEQPLVLGDLDEARRRRLAVLDFYGESPVTAFEVAARSYSLAKLAIIDADLEAAELQYRAATEGFGQLDRPVENSRCLGMVADFDERAGDYRAAIERLEAAIETNESLLGGFTGSLQAHLGWVLLHDGQRARAESVFEGALDLGRRVRHTMVLFQAQAGLAAIHRLDGRHVVAAASATEALALYGPDGFRRFRNRVDPPPTCEPPPRCAARCSPQPGQNATSQNERWRCSRGPTEDRQAVDPPQDPRRQARRRDRRRSMGTPCREPSRPVRDRRSRHHVCHRRPRAQHAHRRAR